MSVKRYEFELYHCNGGEMLVSETGDYVSYDDYAALEQKLAESQREFRAADATIENLQMQLQKLAADNAGLKAAIVEHSQCFTVCKCCGTENDCSHDDVCRAVNETPETVSFLAEVRAIAIETCADDFVSKNNIGGYEIDAIYVYAENIRKGVQS
ncbi:MAG: hypothetical protein NQ081_05600 [Enterobacter cloacae]|nr:hypothetical protein [Enterobacter cloacae]